MGLIFVYTPDGYAIADAATENWLLAVYARHTHTQDETRIPFSSSNILECLRALYREDKIPYLALEFQGVRVDVEDTLRWPIGFCDYELNWQLRAMRPRIPNGQTN